MIPINHVPDVPSADTSRVNTVEVTLFATEAVVEGDHLVIDTSVTTKGMGMHVKKSVATAGGGGESRGGALCAAAAGAPVRVRTQGIQDNVKLVSLTAANALLVADTTTAGTLLTMSGTFAASTKPVARCLVAESGGRGTVEWFTSAGGVQG